MPELPNCPNCAAEMILDSSGGVECPNCGVQAHIRARQEPEQHEYVLGDVHAAPLSDGSWLVTLGSTSSGATLGRIDDYGEWFMSWRRRAVTSADGSFWGDWGEPEVLGWGNNLAQAMSYFQA